MALRKCGTYIRCSTVLVIRQNLDDDGYTIRAVALVLKLLEVIRIHGSGCLLDTAVDGVVRHVVCLCLRDDSSELGVVSWVRSTGLYSQCELMADHGENFALCGIILFLLSTDV